jgi:hypothetical protein
MRSGMGLCLALLVTLILNGQSSSLNPEPTASPAIQQSQAPAQNTESKAASPAVQNQSGSKKHNHNSLPEHNAAAEPTPRAEEKSLPSQLAGRPLDYWLRMYLLVTGAVALVGLGALVLMWRQLREMKAAREHSDRLGRRANEQLGAMRDAAEQTDQLLQQLAEQARIAAEHARSANMAACAAKSSSESFAHIAQSSIHNVQVAEEAMRLQQRAWVFVTDIRAGDLLPGKPVSISMGFKNTGKTPARNVQIATQVDPLPRGHAPEPRLDKAYNRGIIPPEGSVFVNIGNGRSHTQPLTQEELQAIASGDLVVWVYGTLTYDDVFEVRQATMFCYRLQPDGRTFAVAEIYNEAT